MAMESSETEVILDKQGHPMTAEQVEQELGFLIDNFKIQFLLHHDDEIYMADYEPDFRRLHAYDKFLQLKYECYTDWIKNSKKHIQEYPLEHMLTENEKKHLSEKNVTQNEKMIVDHIALNRVQQLEYKAKKLACKDELIKMGVMLPEWEKGVKKKKSKVLIKPQKMDSIDKILYSCDPENNQSK